MSVCICVFYYSSQLSINITYITYTTYATYFYPFSCYSKRLNEADINIQEWEQRLTVSDTRRGHLVQQVRTSSTSLLSQIEVELGQEKETVRSLSIAKRDLEIQLETIKTENSDLSQVVEQADEVVEQLERELNQARKVITDLTQQLSDSYNARKKGAVIAAKRIALINNNTGTGII